MWSTWPHLPDALWVMQQWGFGYVTGGSWTKTTRTGKRAFGTGYILRSTTEPWLIGTIATRVQQANPDWRRQYLQR